MLICLNFVLTGSIELHHLRDHLCNQILFLLLNFVTKRLFLFSLKFQSSSHPLKFYFDTFRPDYSDFRSETLIIFLLTSASKCLFLNISSPFRIKLS